MNNFQPVKAQRAACRGAGPAPFFRKRHPEKSVSGKIGGCTSLVPNGIARRLKLKTFLLDRDIN
jgi:hypothetical protein